MIDNPLQKSLEKCTKLVEKKLQEILPINFKDSRIVESMRYSSLAGGKGLRPFLLMNCAQLFGTPLISSLNAAVAIEMVHTYSLIHDDLPAMDNDDYRRGKLANHKKFNEATAILAGDALLTYAFEILSNKETHPNPTTRCELIKLLAHSAGFKGMIGGQMMDLENIEKTLSKEQIANLHRLKTGELFMASCEMGSILAGASIEDRQKIRYYAHDLGLAFQIKDDLLDHKGGRERKINIDAISNHRDGSDNSSIVDVIGFEQAQEQLGLLINQAKSHISAFGDQARTLIEVCDFVRDRDS